MIGFDVLSVQKNTGFVWFGLCMLVSVEYLLSCIIFLISKCVARIICTSVLFLSIRALKGAKGGDVEIVAPTGIYVTTDGGRLLGNVIHSSWSTFCI